MVSQASLGLVAFSIPVCVGVILFGRFLLGLFGAEFTSGYGALVILLVGQLINSLAGPVGFLMTMTGHQKEVSFVTVICFLLNVLLNVALIPIWGMHGAAVATAVTIILFNLVLYILVQRHIHVDPTVLSFFRPKP